MDGSSTWKSIDNSTCTVDPVPESLAIAALVLCFLTVFGNSLVVIAIVKDPYRELKTIPNYLILNLAVCDLIVGIPSELLLGLLPFIPPQKSSLYGNLYFVAYTSLYFAMVASSLTILTLAFERYIMVEAPFRSKEFLVHSHLKLSIVYIWLLAACAALLSLLNQCNEKEYRLIIVDAVGFPAMVFMFIIYSRIFYLVRKCIRQDLENSLESSGSSLLASDDFNENVRRREREIAMSVFLFVGAFALCWTPCFVMENIFYKASKEKRLSLETPADWVRFSGLLSSLLNPVIYALRYGKFRRAVRAIFRSYCGRTHRFSVLSEEFIRPVV
ncbi:histamine H2 receptor-like [Montipora capricornis]|uniref:histamine H2 receptor-like n=1 Tax=Montipora capricornis TaxID=246305 RepID=UPI0035F15BE2